MEFCSFQEAENDEGGAARTEALRRAARKRLEYQAASFEVSRPDNLTQPEIENVLCG